MDGAHPMSAGMGRKPDEWNTSEVPPKHVVTSCTVLVNRWHLGSTCPPLAYATCRMTLPLAWPCSTYFCASLQPPMHRRIQHAGQHWCCKAVSNMPLQRAGVLIMMQALAGCEAHDEAPVVAAMTS